MNELPHALEPWAAELAILSPQSARAFGPWLQRLALALGPRSRHAYGATGAVDGFRGLARRGSPEHLLISHWLLADEMPDEFLRRASEGELLYLERAHREPAGGSRCVVLFDSGPTQVGAPRLAHLALLVVLARRAREAGSVFAWGALQSPARLRALEAKRDVRELLASRSPLPVAAGDLERWAEELGAPEASAAVWDDVWVVGLRADRVPGVVGPGWLRASRIEVEEEPDASALWVHVRTRGSPRTSIRLDLPAPDSGIRVLRDPYRPRRRTPEASEDGFDLSRGLLFSENGRMLIAAMSEGGFVARSIPRGERDRRRRTLRLGVPEEQVVLGLHASHRRLVAVTTDGGHVYVYDTTGTSAGERFETHAELVGEDRTPMRECWLIDRQLVFTSECGRCFSLSPGEDAGIELVSRDNAALARVSNRFYWLVCHGRGLLWQEGGHRPVASRTLGSFDEVDTGAPPLLSYGSGEPRAAVQRGDGLWEVRGKDSTRLLRPPTGTEVCGLAECAGEAALVVVEGQREILLLYERQIRKVIRASTDISAVAVGPGGAQLAIGTDDQHLRVVRIEDGSELLHLTGDLE